MRDRVARAPAAALMTGDLRGWARARRLALGLAAVAMATVAGGCADAPSPQARVVGPDGAPRLAVRVELAVTPAERVRGLRGHAPLGPRDGLLIVTPGPSELCIVNDGVSFAIDEVFARADGVVAAVEREVAAGDPTPHCHEGIQSVLEVAAGVAARVRPGDRLIAPAP